MNSKNLSFYLSKCLSLKKNSPKWHSYQKRTENAFICIRINTLHLCISGQNAGRTVFLPNERCSHKLFLGFCSKYHNFSPWLESLLWCVFIHQPPCYSLQSLIIIQQSWLSMRNAWTLIKEIICKHTCQILVLLLEIHLHSITICFLTSLTSSQVWF